MEALVCHVPLWIAERARLLVGTCRGCVSGAMIANVREAIAKPDGTYDFDAIDGYDELKYVPVQDTASQLTLHSDHPDVQAKIRRAIEQGHIDVEDFKGVRQPASNNCSLSLSVAHSHHRIQKSAS